ncbi:hypothetical protein C8Q70DRAFT_629189 [Cubamyces menziesii]|nr:hypothetical protein C8Q70DRAFT_629189 [Cubamyces menziesii]
MVGCDGSHPASYSGRRQRGPARHSQRSVRTCRRGRNKKGRRGSVERDRPVSLVYSPACVVRLRIGPRRLTTNGWPGVHCTLLRGMRVRIAFREEKWIRKWIKRKRNGGRGKGKNANAPGPRPSAKKPWKIPELASELSFADATATSAGSMHLVGDLSTGLAWGHRPSVLDSPSSESSPSSRGHSWSGPVAQAYTPLLSAPPSTPTADVPQHLVLTTIRPPTIQVANPGDSFSVPLRTQADEFLSPSSPFVALGTSSIYHGPQPLFPIDPSPAASASLGSLGFDISGATRRLPSLPVGHPTHVATSSPTHVLGERSAIQDHMFGFSAPPSAFTLSVPFASGPGSLTTNAAYMYALLHETGNTAPSDAPPFQAASYFTELTRPSDATPGLWAPGLASSPDSCETTGLEAPAVPLSYRMQLSDLVELMRTVRGVTSPAEDAAMAAPPVSEDATSSTGATATSSPSDGEDLSSPSHNVAERGPSSTLIAPTGGAGLQNPGTTMDEDDSDEDPAEAVTPCGEIELVLGMLGATAGTSPLPASVESVKDSLSPRRKVAIVDGAEERMQD